MTNRTRFKGQAEGYRSGLEDTIAKQIQALGIDPRYETQVIRYSIPARPARYTPDFPLENGIVIETKGRFLAADRKKHLLIKEQHPALDLRFVFSNSKAKLSKASKTTYADWCNKNGFLFSDKKVPESWLLP